MIFFIIPPVNANSDNFIASQDTQNSDTSNFVYYAQPDDLCSEIDKMISSQEFQDYLKKNGINKDDYELKLVPSYSNAHPQVIVHTSNQEWHYSITNVTDNSITANNMNVCPRAAWNKFAVANRYGEMVYEVRVCYMKSIGGGHIGFWDIRCSSRKFLRNNDQLNYNPSAEFDTASIGVYVTPHQAVASAAKHFVGLGNWHVAYIKRGGGGCQIELA